MAQLFSLGVAAMRSTFHSSSWQIAVPSPWKAQEFEECVEITKPEGIGALHISSALKQVGTVSDSEAREQLQRECPDETDVEPARFGDFIGYGAENIDWSAGLFWKKWIVSSGRVLLFITYRASVSPHF